jgi:hypothetical protein
MVCAARGQACCNQVYGEAEEISVAAASNVIPTVQPDGSFYVTLFRPSLDLPWGMDLDAIDRQTLWIQTLREGHGFPTHIHNKTCPHESTLRPGFHIVEINSTRKDPEALIRELRDCTEVKMLVRRPHVFTSMLERQPEERLGVEVAFGEKSTCLLVSVLHDGAASRAKPPLRAGDLIVAVDGSQGTPEEMLARLQASCICGIRVSRLHAMAPESDVGQGPLGNHVKAESDVVAIDEGH